MAYQAHRVRWDILASNLRYYSPPVIHDSSRDCTNLHFKRKPQQAKELGYFAESLARTIEEHTRCEREKYPPSYEPPNPGDIIIDDDVARKITPTVFRWRMDCSRVLPSEAVAFPAPRLEGLCRHETGGFECGCPLPMGERKAAALSRQDASEDAHENFYFPVSSWPSILSIELVKTLLLYGEIDPILRAGSRPGCDYRPWHERTEYLSYVPDAGWDRIYVYGLTNYICLNVLFYFPELWDPETMTKKPERSRDYRDTAMYQRMLHACTRRHILSQTATYPHRQFFAVGDDQFRSETTNWGGKLAFEDFLQIDSSDPSPSTSTPFTPGILDVYNVEETLMAKGLPAELVWQVLELTEYNADHAAKRRLKVDARHPFHRDNREELYKYLRYCWRTVVWCNVLAKAQQIDIDWKSVITRIFNVFFSTAGGERVWLS